MLPPLDAVTMKVVGEITVAPVISEIVNVAVAVVCPDKLRELGAMLVTL